MNKNSFNSYLCIPMAAIPAQKICCAEGCLSQHDLMVRNLCFDFPMCKMMMHA